MNSVFIKLTGNKDRHKISDEFEFRSYLTSHFGVMCPLSGEKNDVSSFSQSPLIGSLSNLRVTRTGRIFVKLAGNEDRHKSSNEFEFRPDRIIHFGVIRP